MEILDFTKSMTWAASLFPGFQIKESNLAAWYGNFKNVGIDDFQLALKAACNQEGRKFFPSAGEVQAELVNLTSPKFLLESADEALEKRDLNNPITRECVSFTNRHTPKPTGQFNSPEDLAQAMRIYRATWRRTFKEQFERLHTRIKTQMRLGIAPQSAIDKVLSEQTLQIGTSGAVKNLVSETANRKAIR